MRKRYKKRWDGAVAPSLRCTPLGFASPHGASHAAGGDRGRLGGDRAAPGAIRGHLSADAHQTDKPPNPMKWRAVFEAAWPSRVELTPPALPLSAPQVFVVQTQYFPSALDSTWLGDAGERSLNTFQSQPPTNRRRLFRGPSQLFCICLARGVTRQPGPYSRSLFSSASAVAAVVCPLTQLKVIPP